MENMWEDTKKEKEYFCPECGEQIGILDDVYLSRVNDTIAGCSVCMQVCNAQEWFEEQESQAALLKQNYEDDSFAWGIEDL